MLPEEYKIRCDKHQFKPYEYCEMCMIRSYLQDSIENNSKTVREQCASICLAISVIHDYIDKFELLFSKTMDRINWIEKKLNESNDKI